MSYTPINWQTGDTITAEKLNKMDNGWSISNTQLFSETVTTADVNHNGLNIGVLEYATEIHEDLLIITFDSVDYSCACTEMNGQYFYGGFDEQGPDFTEYPFAMVSDSSQNVLVTENAGTYTVTVKKTSVEVADNFKLAVETASNSASGNSYRVVDGATTFIDAHTAFASGADVYGIVNISGGVFKYLILASFPDMYKMYYMMIHTSGEYTPIGILQASSADGVLIDQSGMLSDQSM